MGKQAKLKKNRKLQSSETPSASDAAPAPDKFLKTMQKQGYSLKKSRQAPEIPKKRIEPQI